MTCERTSWHEPEHDAIARAFDALADSYDALYGPEGNAVMTWLREVNLRWLEETFPPGTRLLELGCGTGEEAIRLAAGGRIIYATDISPRMAAITARKAAKAGLAARVKVAAMAAGHAGALTGAGPFDGAYSSFGALNCEPDLAQLARTLHTLLKPGSFVVCSVMGRWPLFEMAWHLAHLRPNLAFRRLRRGWHRAAIAPGAGAVNAVAMRYLSGGEIRRLFSPYFTVRLIRALGLLIPPPYLDPFFRRHRRLFALLEPLERWLRERWPWYHAGDHIAIWLQRRDDVDQHDGRRP